VNAALQVAHTFLGLRLECAQCHRHPHDVWQQDDLLSFANFFMPVRKIGFQGDNEKKFPEVAAVFKRMNAEAKTLAEQVKKLRGGEYKKLEAQARTAKTEADRITRELAKVEKTDPEKASSLRQALAMHQATLAQFDTEKQRIGQMERQSKRLPEVARRLLHAEVRLLPPGKDFATVTSPLGKQTSKRFRLLGQSDDITIPEGGDPRQIVMDWMRRPDNPYFARAIVNRVWAHYFGRGLIDPPDNLSRFNPATHPELLQELAEGFIRNKYDLKWLHRVILRSRTYQQSSVAREASLGDRTNYASFAYRRLPAEVLLDALNQVTGTTEKMGMEYYHWPIEMKTVEIPYAPKNAFVVFILEHFGRPKRNSAVQCDCERDGNASVLQVLGLANHPRLWQKISDDNGRVAGLLREVSDDRARTEELFLSALGRLPTAAEQQACRKYLEGSASVRKGFEGILWSLLNTREFILQH
jgi:DNA-binding transcriptional regulator YiaG